jgi:hypothetical protein
MKLTLEATGRIETIRADDKGVPARIWKGKTESGIEVIAYISIIQVHKDVDNLQFERELREIKTERQLVSFDMRMVL